MKNAMKKIMGLLLVAVLLVSVVPFQALAADATTLVVAIEVDGKEVFRDDAYTPSNGSSARIGDLYWYNYVKDNGGKDAFTFQKATIWPGKTSTTNIDDTVAPGQSVRIYLKSASTPAPDPDPTESTAKTIDVVVKIDGVVKDEFSWEPANGKSAKVSDLLSYGWMSGWDKTYKPVVTADRTGAWSRANGSVQFSDSIQVGDTLTVNVTKIAEDTTPAVAPIKVVVKVGSSNNVVKEFTWEPANGKSSKVGDLLTYGWNKDWDNVYDFDYAWSNAQQKELTKTQSVNAGDTLYIMLKTSSSSGSSSSGSSDNKFPYKVYLHVYLNNDIGEPHRNINITNTLAVDGTVSMSEVKNLIPTYYTAKDSSGIGYDGLYLAKGNWVKDYVTDSNKMDKLTDVDVRTGEEYVHINVMITNAKAKSTSTADSSNPKTGDAIFMTITVMGLSAAALTGMYFYDKKRKVL